MLYAEIRKVDPPLSPTQRSIMKANIVIDCLIGIVPLLGDYLDGIYKCNSRNVAILEKELVKRVKERAEAYAEEHGLQMAENRDQHLSAGPPPKYAAHDGPRQHREVGHSGPKSSFKYPSGGRTTQQREYEDESSPPLPPRKNTEMSQRGRY